MDCFGELRNVLYILLVLGGCLCLGVYAFIKRKKLNLLPGPRGLPIFGILPFLGEKPHLELYNLGKKYGGLYSVYFGRTYVVVVTDVVLAKQLLNKNSTADRPPDLFQFMPDGVGMAQHNGLEWVEQRRYTMAEMRNLGFGRSNWEKHVQMEVSDFLDVLTQSQGKPIEINKQIFASVSNNILTLLTNHRLPVGEPKRDMIDHGVESFLSLYNQSGIIVHFPKLFKFLVDVGLLGVGHKLKDMINMNKCIRQEIEELKEDNRGQSFIDTYLTEIEKNKELNLGSTFNEINLVGNSQALIIGGSDTTYASLVWLLLAMASFPEKQRKVHEELDNVLGKDGTADWVDRHKLPYCLATILEGQRWRTIVPLNLSHCTNEDMIVNGYDIPKGTTFLPLLWAFHNDTKYWDDPDVFQPERFMSTDGNNVKDKEGYIPFSYGKRICPGKTVAYIELFHYFLSIMQKFEVLPETETLLPDLEGLFGLTLEPQKQPLRFVPR